MIQHGFMNKILFEKTRDRAFLEFLNEQGFSATYIATYLDNEMKKGFKGISDVEVENKLKAIIQLFQCLHARDVFMKQYERDYASRLLNKTSLSQEHEELFLNKLKVECGA